MTVLSQVYIIVDIVHLNVLYSFLDFNLNTALLYYFATIKPVSYMYLLYIPITI